MDLPRSRIHGKSRGGFGAGEQASRALSTAWLLLGQGG